VEESVTEEKVYRVAFVNQGKVYEIYVRNVSQGALLGFVEVEGIVFGETSAVLVDPAEERLKSEFAGVRRSYIPMHAVIRIDEVEKRGTAKILTLSDKGDKVTPIAGLYPVSGGPDKA
jgi:hypothetical protein